MKIIIIFALGIIMLAGALVINIIASRIGFLTWYDFLDNYKQADFKAYFWLFLIYPMLLGIIAYIGVKLLNII
ncbi:MAG: hypothetical protein GF349_03000 [Candidatus Magasanikbacteria bacterium]|nr:hypothetical protein [Candidatus Magasanikbacteria bacterium]